MRTKKSIALLTALLALGAAAPANACQLVCLFTHVAYQGNLGGVAGADAKCAAEFPGFKFSRSASMVANLAGFGGEYSGTVWHWAGSDTDGQTTNCQNWTSNNGTDNAEPITANANNVYTYYYVGYHGCSNTHTLMCCNM